MIIQDPITEDIPVMDEEHTTNENEHETPDAGASGVYLNAEQAAQIFAMLIANDKKKRRGGIVALVAVALAVVLVAIVTTMLVLPYFVSRATIVLSPAQRTLSITTQLSASEIDAHMLSTSEKKTIATTGTKHIAASVASGTVIFYNSLPSAQTISSGTQLTGADGVEIVTDARAYLAAAQTPTETSASVSAHTLATGAQANIAAGDLYGPCSCANYIIVSNTAFYGGQTARDYHVVTQQDLASVKLSPTFVLSAGEAISASEHCSQTTSANAGDEAERVTITKACTALVYSTTKLQQRAAQLLATKAQEQLGVQYTETQIAPASLSTKFALSASATYQYHFTSAELSQLTHELAGVSQSQAYARLSSAQGVAHASIQSSSSLPSNPDHITIQVAG